MANANRLPWGRELAAARHTTPPSLVPVRTMVIRWTMHGGPVDPETGCTLGRVVKAYGPFERRYIADRVAKAASEKHPDCLVACEPYDAAKHEGLPR
jgi:hypothetical protein